MTRSRRRLTPFSRTGLNCIHFLVYAASVSGQFTSQPRWGQAVAVVNNVLYVSGGKTDRFGSYSYTSAPTSNDLFSLDLSQDFDPSSPPWSYICGSEDESTRQGNPLAWHTLSAYNTSQLLSFGGDGGPNSPITLPGQTNSAELLDISSSDGPEWIVEAEGWAHQPSRRIRHTAASDGGKVYLVGGERNDGSSMGYSDHYVFDPGSPSFTPLPTENAPPAIYGHGSVVLSDGRLLIFGGYSQNASGLVPFSTIWSLDTTQPDLTWRTESVSGNDIPPGRRAFAYTWLEGDRVLIHGGSDAEFQTSFSDGWILDTTTNPMTWSNVSALSQVGARRDHFAVQVGSQVLFCFGYGTNAGAPVRLVVFDYDRGAFTSSFTPQSGPSLTTLPSPGGTGGNSPGGSHGTGPGGTGGSNPTGGSDDPSSPTDGTDPDGDGDNGSKRNIAVIAVGVIMAVLAAAVAAGLLIVFIIRRRRNQRQFYLLNNEDERPRPSAPPPWELAGIALLPWFRTRRALARGEKTRAADKKEGWAVLGLGRPRERVDMLANEDASELGVGRRAPGRYGSGDSRSWYSLHDAAIGHERYESDNSIGRLFSGSLNSIKNIGSGVRRVFSGESAKSHGREWTDVSLPLDPYEDSDGLLLHDNSHVHDAGLLFGELEQDIALAVTTRGGREGSSASKYSDPFRDQEESNVLFDASPRQTERPSLDGSDPPSGGTQSQKDDNVRSSQSTLSHATAAPQLPPLIAITSKSTSDGKSSPSFLDGSNPGHSSSSSSHQAALSSASSSRPRTTSIINSPPPPSTSPVKRSDSWWTRFRRTRTGSFRETSQDLGKPQFARLDLDFRDPNPLPGRLSAIKEASGGSAGAAESPRISRLGENGHGHEKALSGSSSKRRLYMASGLEQSTTSLKTSRTADSAALERLAGRVDVAFREATGTSIDGGSSYAESLGGRRGSHDHERDTTWSTVASRSGFGSGSGSRRYPTEASEGQDVGDVGNVFDDREVVQSPTTEVTPTATPFVDVPGGIEGSIRPVVSHSLPVSPAPPFTTSLTATLKGMKGKNPISPGTVATRVANYERRMSLETSSIHSNSSNSDGPPPTIPSLSSPSPSLSLSPSATSTRTPRSLSNVPSPISSPTPVSKRGGRRKSTNVNVKYGLVQRPELFIANPDRDRHSLSGSSDV